MRYRYQSRKSLGRTTRSSKIIRVIRHYASRKLENFGLLGSAAIIERSLWKTKAATFGSGLVPTKSMFACFMGSQPNVRLKTERAPQRLC
jgi:ribosomal protein S8E